MAMITFSWKSAAVENLTEKFATWGRNKGKFCQRLQSMLFMMMLSVSSNFNCFWQGSIFKIFFKGEGLEERTKTRLYFRALFVHCDAAPQQVSKKKNYKDWTTDWTCIFFKRNFWRPFQLFFLWLLSAQGQCILEKVSWYR